VASGKVAGKETISVPAGKFDTTRIEFHLRTMNDGTVTVWYSDLHKRIVKQRGIFGRHGFAGSSGNAHLNSFRFDGTLELSAIRLANR
jgi:hypothetical protein